MNTRSEKIPAPKELEKEIGDYLTKKFGGNVKISTPIIMPQEDISEKSGPTIKLGSSINFDLKPNSLIAYLDQFIVKQDHAKAILSTKICTHFNRIRYYQSSLESEADIDMVGRIKNNILMVGPTGVGKTYMVKLIAKKIGVPFVKGDATKFSETGYVGGDVEDLVRDLVREADGDMAKAQYGIIYIDEIDKIASSRNLVGADVSRTGVQRALLKPLEETEVDLKVPHDPISMIQEIERFRKTGKRENNTLNTKNILFIVSGAFNEINEIINKRLTDKGMGFGATLLPKKDRTDILKYIRSEDLIKYGFESEFVGRLPVRAIFEHLKEADLYHILRSPNNPIILGKKLDFAAYGIKIKFSGDALKLLAKRAFDDNTGARGLVSAVEEAMILFEKKLPSTSVTSLAISADMIAHPEKSLGDILSNHDKNEKDKLFEALCVEEKEQIVSYVTKNKASISERNNLPLTEERIQLIGNYYIDHITDIDHVIQKIKSFYEETKALELHFLKNYGINLVLEEDAIDHIIEQFVTAQTNLDEYFKHLTTNFEHGLKLIRDKIGQNRFFISKDALINPEAYISSLLN